MPVSTGTDGCLSTNPGPANGLQTGRSWIPEAPTRHGGRGRALASAPWVVARVVYSGVLCSDAAIKVWVADSVREPVRVAKWFYF